MKTKENQYKKLSNFPHQFFGGESFDNCDYVIFRRRDGKKDTVRVTFEDYILKPFDGFTLHEQYNNNIAPKHKIMYGRIVAETNGMYQLSVASDRGEDLWRGWVPKKSVVVERLNYDEDVR